MKNKMVLSIFTTILALSSCAKESVKKVVVNGHSVGNGGDVVVCDSNYESMNDKKMMILDYYQASNDWGMMPDLGGTELSVDEKVHLVIQRIAKKDPNRAALYAEYYNSFWDEAEILTYGYFPEIPDDGPISLPGADCVVEQAAYQQKPILDHDKRYYFKGELWQKLDSDERAGLILHEIIYRETISAGEKDSRTARYFNALAASGHIHQMGYKDYSNLLENTMGLSALYTYSGIDLEMKSLQFNVDGQVLSGETPTLEFEFQGIPHSSLDGQIQFAADGGVSFVSKTHTFKMHPGLSEDCTIDVPQGSILFLSKEGRLREVQANEDASSLTVALNICHLKNGPLPHDRLLLSLDRSLTFTTSGIPEGALTPVETGLFEKIPNVYFTKSDALPLINTISSIYLDADGYLDIEINEDIFEFQHPGPRVNLGSFTQTKKSITINAQDEAQKLYDALKNFHSYEESDGLVRYFTTPWSGISLACKFWTLSKGYSCLLKMSEEYNHRYSSDIKAELDDGIWKSHLVTNRRAPNEILRRNLNQFLENFGIRGHESCGNATSTVGFGGKGYKICAYQYDGLHPLLSVEIEADKIEGIL